MLPGPHQPGEDPLIVSQAVSPSRLHGLHELLVDAVQQAIQVLKLVLPQRRKGIQEGLAFAGMAHAPLHPQLVDGVDKAEPGGDDPYGTHQTGLVGVDLVRRHGDVIAAGGAQVANHRIDGEVRALALEAVDLVVDATGLHRTAPRAVDAEDDAGCSLVLVGGPQALRHIVRRYIV